MNYPDAFTLHRSAIATVRVGPPDLVVVKQLATGPLRTSLVRWAHQSPRTERTEGHEPDARLLGGVTPPPDAASVGGPFGQQHLPPSLLRLSVGIENAEELWADLALLDE